MKDLKAKIETELYFRDNDHDKDNFYNFFLLNECYYKSYRTRIECHIGENYITKTIRKKFEIVNPSKKMYHKNSIWRGNAKNKLYQIKKKYIPSGM